MRRVLGILIATSAVVVAACTPPPPADGTPVIYSFTASKSSGSSPLTTALTWHIADADDPVLTCRLDLDGDGTYDVTDSACTSDSVRSATFDTPGTHTVRLQVDDGTTAVTSDPIVISVGPPSPDSYEITVRFTGTLTPSQEAAFTDAADRWSEVIRTGLADIALDIPANTCLSGAPAFSGTIDDVLIDAAIVPIDGPGGILGAAGQCLTRTGTALTAYGMMRFDEADVADLETAGVFDDVILHEMGHVLGLGGVSWLTKVSGLLGPDPVYTGIVARGAWDAITGGDGVSVPVANTGGLGTRGKHWREADLGDELMTGYLSGPTQPLSTVTIGSLADLGYGVDMGAADPFGTPARAQAGPALEINTQLITPVGEVG